MSCTQNTQFLLQKIEEFIEEMRESLEEMESDEFEEIIESILIEIRAKFLNLAEETAFFGGEIQKHEYLFERSEEN